MTRVDVRPPAARAAPSQAYEWRDAGQERASSTSAWVLFILLNCSLFMRPADIVPQLEGLPIYEVNILLCLALALPALLNKLAPPSLGVNPITLCVFALLPAIVLSLVVVHGDTWNARMQGIDFVKIIIYYLLLVTLVDSTHRLKQFLYVLLVCSVVLNVVALLSYHKVIDLATVVPMEESQSEINPDTGEPVYITRLVAAGIYGNPNDLARIIVVGITVCFYGVSRTKSWLTRVPWVGPLTLLGYALQLTYSRGGLLALLAGIVTLFHARYGTKKGGFALLLVLPVLLVFGGRQSDISTSKGTGQLRVQLWSEGLVALRSSPIFGIGRDRYVSVAGNHAHNSFVEAYVETGLFGGTVFTAAVYFATVGIYRLRDLKGFPRDPDLWAMRPYVLALIVGTFVGQFSSSRAFSLPTYMTLGVGAAYLSLAARQTRVAVERVSPRLLVKVIVIGICGIVSLHLYTKFNAHF